MKGQKTIHVMGALVLTVMVVALVYSIVQGEFNSASAMLDSMSPGGAG